MNNCGKYMQFHSPLTEIDLSAIRKPVENKWSLWKVTAHTVFNKRIEHTIYAKDKQTAIAVVLNAIKNISIEDAIKIS